MVLQIPKTYRGSIKREVIIAGLYFSSWANEAKRVKLSPHVSLNRKKRLATLTIKFKTAQRSVNRRVNAIHPGRPVVLATSIKGFTSPDYAGRGFALMMK